MNVREPSWHWSASFMLPGVSRNTTSVTAGGSKMAVCVFLSATLGDAVEASLKQECAPLDTQTR